MSDRNKVRPLRWIEEFSDAEFYPLNIKISEMETAISQIDNEGRRQGMLGKLKSQDYFEPSVFLYKRRLLEFDIIDLQKFIMSNPVLMENEPLRKGFISMLLNDNIVPISMYAIKNRMVSYH